jgi:ParB family chromosome partitioning protein
MPPSIVSNAIFWVEVDRIKPNPYQPRREFDEDKLKDLAESIRQYGVLQPLVVTRQEVYHEDGGLSTEYELIAGERRLRASKIAGLAEIPVIIRAGEQNDRLKLELAIIENLQREDLNPLDRAYAFERLAKEFGFSHSQIGHKISKSRVYVSNTIRILGLPDEMKDAVAEHKITEGHTRPLLMLVDRPEEQQTLFKEIIHRQMTVRDAEEIARRIALERAKKKGFVEKAAFLELEVKLAESLGTRVHIQQRDVGGGKILIDYFSDEELEKIVNLINSTLREGEGSAVTNAAVSTEIEPTTFPPSVDPIGPPVATIDPVEEPALEDDRELYSVTNFSI